MKTNKTIKHLQLVRLIIYFIEYGIAFSIAENLTGFWGIRYKTYISLDFAIYIIIVTISAITFEFIVSKIKDIGGKRKKSNNNKWGNLDEK